MRIKLHDGGWMGSFADANGIFNYLRFDVEDGPVEYLQFKLDHFFFRSVNPNGNDKPEEWTERLTAYALSRLAGLDTDEVSQLASPSQKYPTIEFLLDESDAQEVSQLPAPKSCRYQGENSGDLYCLVGKAPGQEPPVPTTRGICSTCDLPDERWACDHLHHAVVGIPDEHPVILRAMCDRGRSEVQSGAIKCRPGGHSCWERTVAPAKVIASEAAPLALHESLDYLDAVWKGAFGSHLLQLRGASVVGKLATPCQSRSDLEVKLSALADTMSSFSIQDDDLAPQHRGDANYGPGRTIARLDSALTRWASTKAAEEETVRLAHEGVLTLQRVMALRRGFQHTGGGASGKLPVAFAALGLSVPPPAPDVTWSRVRERVLSAFDAIRRLLR